MSQAMLLAAAALAEALEAENDALRAMDVARAVAHFPQKEASARHLRSHLSAPAIQTASQFAAARICATRLQALAAENRRLLERALFVQGRLIATLARAAPPPRVGYGDAAPGRARDGAARAGRSVPPMTLSARA